MTYKSWVAHIQAGDDTEGSGLAIGPRHVLTAAHVLGGDGVRARFPRQDAGKWVNLAEAWSSPQEAFDIALLELTEGEADLAAPVVPFRLWVGQDERWSTEGSRTPVAQAQSPRIGEQSPSPGSLTVCRPGLTSCSFRMWTRMILTKAGGDSRGPRS